MSDRLVFRLAHDRARANALAAVRQAPPDYIVEVKPPTRSLEQNRLLWSCLTDLSEQLLWDGEHLTPAEYKDLLTASLRKQKVVRGTEGGLVFLGASTSKMDTHEFSELLELIFAFGAQRGVVFHDREGVAA